MKDPLLSAAAAGLVLTGCESFNQPLSSGEFDPLRAPGSGYDRQVPTGPAFTAGQFVRAVSNNTAFFNERPRGNVDADKLLPRGTSMKVIAIAGTYLRVELDSGEVGFVPTVMVEDPNAVEVDSFGDSAFQVYPPLDGFSQPMPLVPPGEPPPGGAIPTVIDPEAPGGEIPVPPVQPVDDTFPAPVDEAPPGPAPLPPNQDDLEAERAAAGGEVAPEVTPRLEE